MTSLKTVGDENLPNLFIDKIYVYHATVSERVVKKIRVFLSAFDHKDSPSWFDRQEMQNMLIKVALVSHDPLIESLNSGTNLVDIEVPNIFNPNKIDNSSYDFKSSYIGGSLNPTLTEELGDFIKYIYMFEFEIEPPPVISGQASPGGPGTLATQVINNLNLYCCFYMDSFGFNIPEFDKYYGPMDGEVIYSGGEINQESGYFYYPDTNEEYSGPVHAHQGMYMEGSVHLDSPHKEVKYVAINNLKIKLIKLQETQPGVLDSVDATIAPEGLEVSTGGYTIE